MRHISESRVPRGREVERSASNAQMIVMQIEAHPTPASAQERAEAVLAGGCDSPVRSGHAVGGAPFIQSRGAGAYAYDERGDRYIDYIMAYGPLLFGHAHPAFCTGLDEIAMRGTLFGSTHEEEVRLAERIRGHLPSMQRMRFTSTGTEAVMSAVRVARGFTRRDLIVKFGGNYHGHFDLALLNAGASAHTSDPSRGGIPQGVMHDVIVTRYNDLEALDAALAGNEERLAAIIVEPVVGNMGIVQPVPGFLEGLRERTQRFGALLIFDEVITWLRLGLRGAQARVGVIPDLTTIGKIMGGGYPIAAFGGRADVMAALAPEGATFTGGTHAGNPFSIAMAHRTLDFLENNPTVYAGMDGLAKGFAAGIVDLFAKLSLPYTVVQLESIVDFKFRPGATRNYDDASAADRAQFARYYHEMRKRKILLAPSQNEVMFLSTAHTAADIDETLTAMESSLQAL
ncbi:MAG: glutamate-1-semialdehyde 2,1-aminomutase [Candidatus Eremiobacteraeota bacterium]|nr:glutamate-1-semialdehyde 2,1-aminomutase [Candidatus Eremiobacteraeota bacterium]